MHRNGNTSMLRVLLTGGAADRLASALHDQPAGTALRT